MGKKIIILLLAITSFYGCKKETGYPMELKPPVAKKIKKIFKEHGKTREDNYYWMKNRKSKKVIDHLNEENKYTDKMSEHFMDLQKKLYKEMRGRIKETDMTVPYRKDGYLFYTRDEEGKEYSIYCMKKDEPNAKEIILLDANVEAKGHKYFDIGRVKVADNKKLFAYTVDLTGRRKFEIRFKNIETGKNYDDKIENTSGGVTWAADNQTIFYTVKEKKTLRSYKIYKHILGSKKKDKMVYHEKDDTFSTYVYRSKSKKYLIINSYSTLSTESRVLKADNPDGVFKVFFSRKKDHEYYISHLEDKFLVLTNWKAKNFRLMETPETKTNRKNWVEVIPHRDDVLLDGFDTFKDYLVLEERKNGQMKIRVINRKNPENDHYIDFDQTAYSADTVNNYEFDTKKLRFTYTSMSIPTTVYDYDMEKREKILLKRKEVLGGYDPDDYITERLYARARDGVAVPLSMVYKKGIKKDGANPLLLNAYGSYGHTLDPEFYSITLSLLERGFIFVIAHIRGGQMLGRQWYEDGKLLKKKNTFTDFIDSAEFLIQQKYTNSGKLFIEGGSAGGLLMGAVVNMRPDLFKGVIADVPFVDVMTTMLDSDIPLTTSEYDEWGDPRKKKFYDYMLSYSPYDNVEKKEYPAMLVNAGIEDSQVQYWEPAKWVAKLREMKTDKNPLLLKMDMSVGHGGKSGRFEIYEDWAFSYAFILDLAGFKD